MQIHDGDLPALEAGDALNPQGGISWTRPRRPADISGSELELLASASRRASIISAIGAVIVFGSLLFAFQKLYTIEESIAAKQKELAALDAALSASKDEVTLLSSDVDNLRKSQNDLLDFLAKVTDKKQISILDKSVNWDLVKESLAILPSGKRKQAIFSAILLAWKEIPFTMGGKDVTSGFDSPRFLEFVLRQNGVLVEKRSDQRMSDALMAAFKKVEKPSPGDLVFYKGQEGSFGFIYLADASPPGAGYGIGTLQKIAPLQIINLNNINTPYFPLIGYFHVVYPDEN